ncbi:MULTISPECIES: class I SAM-dependent methyltransferase [Streptomyces]|uniref:SAM-dependent methyltransferase n=1 Tax=Streptomyces venezuelae TaxID=54571 RepID=A0A5P2BIU4_STRVZ|nr:MULTISPECIES: class I SAM-dependent methyltransferase [Streptomyces]NDZ98661.1 methyltransferase domain-containing protein [Streptomyces sp. SID10116]MYY85201.1 methyltransferase domain-containing protein [Streptomyces sp. SID335]MYZ14227.1 methyltransferase domain-containing protein [Streptomyces sp. SID337]NDZ84956.1 methyltransferase domain-containing protein [Streptomyces sp. SID10115]NEA00340.1 methyltransferase domain-containing protein [Streptomyces sp. SID10116]
MSVTSRYRAAWEGFWQEAPDEPGAVFWDAEPILTVGLHLALFEPHMTAAGLPLVDLGCGNGTQTRFLADRFPRVLGVDLSAAALEHARRADPADQVDFRELDAVEKSEAEQLHAEIGDANVYMRGVLHQCDPADRQPLLDSIATLLGERGRAFVVEPSEAARPVLMGLAQGPAGPPPKLAPIFAHGLAPAEVADASVGSYVEAAGLVVLASGELPLTTTEFTSDGTRIELPSRWLVVGRRG